MKLNWTEETTTKTVSGAVILIVAIAFYFLLQNFSVISGGVGRVLDILNPFFIGFIIAYLLSRPVNFFQRKFDRHLFKKSKRQHSLNRALSITVSMLLVLTILGLVIYAVIPQLISSISAIANDFNGYIQIFSEQFHIDASLIHHFLGSSQELLQKFYDYISSNIFELVNLSITLGSKVINFIVATIVSVYMLASKEKFTAQAKKILFACFPLKFVTEIIHSLKHLHKTFGGYFIGQILDSLLVGALCFIFTSLIGMEYPLLLSVIVTVTNLIPLIGPFIGTVPCAMILFMTNPLHGHIFIIMVVVLQQLDANIFVPRIVGKTTGLASFWVLFSILLCGGLFGLVGVLIAVPLFSVVYTFTRRIINHRLRKQGLSTNTADYYNELPQIEASEE